MSGKYWQQKWDKMNFLKNDDMNADQENFKNLFNSIYDFLFILDLNGNIIEVNNAVVTVLGYTKDELHGKNVLAVHPPEYRDKANEIVGKMIEGKRESCPLPLLSKSGIHVPVETKIYHGQWNNEKVLIGISRNLSELAISEEKFFHVFDNNQALMAISKIDSGIFVNVNKTFLDKLGYDKSEIIGHSSKELNLFYDYNQRIDLALKIKENSIIENEQTTIYSKDNRPIHCLFSLSLIQIQTYNYLLTSAIDITALKQAEEKLKNSLKQQILLADISQNLLSLDDFDKKINKTLEIIGKHTDVSRVYIFEDNSEGTATCNTYEWCNDGITPQIQNLINIPYETIPSWKPMLEKEGRIFSTNIKELPGDLSAILEPQEIKSILVFPLFVHNRFWGFIGFDECKIEKNWKNEEVELVRTISGIISNYFDRHIFQKQLIESELRQKLAIENTQAGLWDWNIQTGELFVNDTWCKMIGYNKDEIEPNVQSWKERLNPDDMPLAMQNLKDHISGKSEYYESTHRFLTKSGKWKWVYDRGKIIEYDSNNQPKRAIGIHIDIDNQKRIEENLRNLNATKDKFFSIIAHDLRGPIGSMMQISEMISDKDGLDNETLSKFLNSQKELSKSTFQLLENLLNWAMFNREQIQYNPKIFELGSIVDENILNIKYRAQQKGISIITDYSHTYNVYADEDMVKLIIRNLLSNALKFTGKNGFIHIEFEQKDKYLEVKIIDTGIGISEENIEKIISDNEFYSTYGTANEKGTGLGLKLCKNFIVQNKGELKIESKINVGTTFSFTLPVFEF